MWCGVGWVTRLLLGNFGDCFSRAGGGVAQGQFTSLDMHFKISCVHIQGEQQPAPRRRMPSKRSPQRGLVVAEAEAEDGGVVLPQSC